MLVNAAWVNDLVSSKNPQTYPGNGYVILELVSSNSLTDPIDSYNAGHIPGAPPSQYSHLEQRTIPIFRIILTAPSINGKLLYGSDLQAKNRGAGITKDTTVVLYEYWDGTWAARVAWELLYAGVEDVRLLNGGWNAWVAGGYTIEKTANTGQQVSFGATVPVHPEYRAETTDVTAALSDPSVILADTRSWEPVGKTRCLDPKVGIYLSFLTSFNGPTSI